MSFWDLSKIYGWKTKMESSKRDELVSSITVTKYLRKSTWRRKFLFWFMGHKFKGFKIYGLLSWLPEVRQKPSWCMERGKWMGRGQRTCSFYLDPVSLKFLSTLRDYQILNLVINEPLLSTKHLAHGLGVAVQIQTTLCSFKIRIGKRENWLEEGRGWLVSPQAWRRWFTKSSYMHIAQHLMNDKISQKWKQKPRAQRLIPISWVRTGPSGG